MYHKSTIAIYTYTLGASWLTATQHKRCRHVCHKIYHNIVGVWKSCTLCKIHWWIIIFLIIKNDHLRRGKNPILRHTQSYYVCVCVCVGSYHFILSHYIVSHYVTFINGSLPSGHQTWLAGIFPVSFEDVPVRTFMDCPLPELITRG